MTPFINPFIVSGHIADKYFCDRKNELTRWFSTNYNAIRKRLEK
jgi:hypothetical protein